MSARTSQGDPNYARDAAISAANQHCARLSKQLLLFFHLSMGEDRCKRKARLAGRGRASSALMCHRPAGVPPTSFKRPGLFVVPPTGNHNLQEHQIPLGSSGRGGLRSSISYWCLASNLEGHTCAVGIVSAAWCRRGLRVMPGISTSLPNRLVAVTTASSSWFAAHDRTLSTSRWPGPS